MKTETSEEERAPVAIVGAGTAGIRAAQVLVEAGLRPLVIDEGHRAGGADLPTAAGGVFPSTGDPLRQ